MSFTARIAACQLRLTPADQALLALIAADPIGTSLGSASDLARRAGVHGATAGRLAKKLGFADWQAMRDAIRDEHIRRSRGSSIERAGAKPQEADAQFGAEAKRTAPEVRTDPARLQAPLQASQAPEAAPEGDPSMLSRMANGMSAHIKAMLDPVVDSTMEEAARRLCQARVIWIAARGDVAPIGQLLTLRLRRYRLRARPLARDGAGGLAKALPGDVLVEVAGHLPENRHEGLRRRAAARGLTVVRIGPAAGDDSDPPPDLHIPVRPGQTGDAVLAGQLLGALALASTVIKTLRSGAPRPREPARGLAGERATGPEPVRAQAAPKNNELASTGHVVKSQGRDGVTSRPLPRAVVPPEN